MSRDGTDWTTRPDPEVEPMAQRRQFSAEEKVRILEEADACTQPGEIGALLRREGIYSSHLTRWRQARDRGDLAALGAGKRGPKLPSEATLAKECAKLLRENKRLQARLDQAEVIMDIQKKLSLLLGPSPMTNENGERR